MLGFVLCFNNYFNQFPVNCFELLKNNLLMFLNVFYIKSPTKLHDTVHCSVFVWCDECQGIV